MSNADSSTEQPNPQRGKRRRWQFGLSTLLIVITVAAIIARWAAEPEPWEKFERRFEALVKDYGGEVRWQDLSSPHTISFRYSSKSGKHKALDDEGLKRLCRDFRRLGKFRLNLHGCAITDEGLAELASLPHLECLCLSKTKISNAGLERLQEMPSLEFVDLADTAVAADGVGKLREKKQDLTIWWDRQKVADSTKWLGSPVEKQGVVTVAPGCAVLFHFRTNSDSGAALMFFKRDKESGGPGGSKVAWHVHAEPLGVEHSKYRHDMNVRVDGDKVIVHSEGSHGTFVELRDLETGSLLKRWRY
jgi:hypothetical protein